MAKVDTLTGSRGRSALIRLAIERAVEQEQRWADLDSAAATVEDGGHAWDYDPAGWVPEQRQTDHRRAG